MQSIIEYFNVVIINNASIAEINKNNVKIASPEYIKLLKIIPDRNKYKFDIENLQQLKNLDQKYVEALKKKLR